MSAKSPKQHQQEAALLTGYGPIHLRRLGDFAIVEVYHESTNFTGWVEVIREPLDAQFGHIVEPLGIESSIQRVTGIPLHSVLPEDITE